jgi:hypothetical protein
MKIRVDHIADTPDVLSPMAINFLKGLGLIEHDAELDMYVLTEKAVKTNMAICKKCNTCIVSFHRHDFVRCNCEKDDEFIAVDGGADYNRRVGDPKQFLWPTTK